MRGAQRMRHISLPLKPALTWTRRVQTFEAMSCAACHACAIVGFIVPCVCWLCITLIRVCHACACDTCPYHVCRAPTHSWWESGKGDAHGVNLSTYTLSITKAVPVPVLSACKMHRAVCATCGMCPTRYQSRASSLCRVPSTAATCGRRPSCCLVDTLASM